ncbi:branched-chain amino acid ABC transporter permease [Micromonospora cathayae]|uniref:Branched-chain amino acid ABC transporter permease n=1 Tax=Micromonospora cathayae TaxID=3028804 RepID=A0ABY7ZLF3_9ACTN|nr:branched-chain amino acid ABC transporter permease [Micromonospora sp. HUAS 3]WDZ83796.1 branched-chain amino acid ABC transporter permease [Micromonospora sp. HUAS 3]
MSLLLQQICNGIAIGAAYGLFAMGFGLTFATLNVFNVAMGTVATWGAIVALFGVSTLDLPLPVAGALAVVVIGVLGVVINQVCVEPIRRRRDGEFFGVLLTTIGAWIVLLNLATIATDATFQSFPLGSFPRGYHDVLGVTLSSMQLITIGAAAVLGVVLYVFVHRTRAGTTIRAVGADPRSASLAGINPRLVLVGTAFLSAAIVGFSGLLYSVTTNNVSFEIGENLLLKGLAAVIVGGFGDMRGALLGGLLIGLSETLSAQYVSTSFRDAISFGLLLLFLLVRPRGLIAPRQYAQAAS